VACPEDESWGANLSGSPVIAGDDPEERVTVFMVVARTLVRWDAETIQDALTAIRIGSPHHGPAGRQSALWAS
jgi:hypothetical protein